MNGKNIPNASVLAGWRKSSHSGGDNGSCVEIVDGFEAGVPVRDSKTPSGPALVVSEGAWASFVALAKTAQL
ncbi:DUF397 domain-containing protein [Streptomyces sp. NPDC058440]|uniref:DUF397 domain-containing protein n=1 Tax=Streptomyces sp. NPDC058440 TaxID=3346501 RepID=UPI0036494A7A